MTKVILALAFLIAVTSMCFGQAGTPLLTRNPTVNKTHIVFVYAGDLWIVSREGGQASRLTSGVGSETAPVFSPDGTKGRRKNKMAFWRERRAGGC